MPQKHTARVLPPPLPEWFPRGIALLRDPTLNKGTAFSESEREMLGLRGLLPPHVSAQVEQLERVMENFRRLQTPLAKYIMLESLQDRNEALFYRVILEHPDEMMPIIYTPTVGLACQQFGHIYRRPRGLFVSAADRGRMQSVLRNWPYREAAIIVVTDGERILGLGDLGANGMGIPIGKLALYTACAGVHPRRCLPVMLDVGTNNEKLLVDPLYLGLRQQARWPAPQFDELVEEFIEATQAVFPGHPGAVRGLRQPQRVPPAAALPRPHLLVQRRHPGHGQRGGRRHLLGAARDGQTDGASRPSCASARAKPQPASPTCWSRRCRPTASAKHRRAAAAGWSIPRDWWSRRGTELAAHKKPYAHEHAPVGDFIGAVKALKPTAIIGVSATPNTFTREVVETMTRLNERPIVFALSNPTSRAECTAEQAYSWSGGKALFASGSPFDAVDFNGRRYVPRQGNNSYIFPGVGLGVVAVGASRVTDEMFMEAARTLAETVSRADLDQGSLYPPLRNIR